MWPIRRAVEGGHEGGSISALSQQEDDTPFGEYRRTAPEMENLDVVRFSASLSQKFAPASSPWL